MNILFLAPHLSTGGMPQFLLKRIESLVLNHNVFVVEDKFVSDKYVVQRDKIKELIGEENFFSVVGKSLINIIENKKIDIVHLEHEAEGFDNNLMNLLYTDSRSYKIIETCHNVSFNPKNKLFFPDGFAFCSPFHVNTFSHIDVLGELIMYPIEKTIINDDLKKQKASELGFAEKINILSVGLWCDNKNQKKIIELAKKHEDYNFNIVGNQAENFVDYWNPLMENLPNNVIVWGERENISDFMLASDIFLFPSKQECNPIVLREAISHNLPIFANNLIQYCGIYDEYINPLDIFLNFKNIKNIKNKNILNQETSFLEQHNNLYKKVMKNKISKQPNQKVVINHHFVDGAFLEIIGKSENKYKVIFYDQENIVYQNVIDCNSWVKLNKKYFIDYTIKVWEIQNEVEILIFETKTNLNEKRVMISFESSALGDNLAWIPYCDEFQKKHNCNLIVSTFKNFLFKGQYPNITFIERGLVVPNLYAKYDIGWFYDINKEPILPNTIPLQKTATNILGLDFKEIKPKLFFDSKIEKEEIDSKYVCIAPDSTAGCKEWGEKNWQFLVDDLVIKGYEVINVSLNSKYSLDNVIIPKNLSLDNTMKIIHYSEFFIGLSSGLSWLAWSLNKHVYMIANFTNSDHEFQENCTRITNTSVCHGCWNNKNFKFDKGNFNWCPILEGYDNQFECQKGITPKSVIRAIDLKI